MRPNENSNQEHFIVPNLVTYHMLYFSLDKTSAVRNIKADFNNFKSHAR